MQINDEGKSNGFISYSFNPFTAKTYPLGVAQGLATEAKIKELHLKALADFDLMQDSLPSKADAYSIVPGQVVFLNGYGQDEYNHERCIVYKVTEDQYFYICEDSLKISHDSLNNLKDIKEKFGIGYYYKKGDVIQDPEFINNLLIDAHEKKAKDEAEKPAREAQERAEHEKAVNELLEKYPYLIRSDKNGGVHVAKNIRIELKRAFPDVKFSITSEYSSVNIKWTDGPSLSSVKRITDKYEDHTTDFTGDFRDYTPSLFNDLFGGCNYIFEHRSWSESTEQKFIDWATEKRSNDVNRDARHLFYDSDIPASDFIITRREDEHGWHVESVAAEFIEEPQPDSVIISNTRGKINRNTEKNGIEISFDHKPDDKVLESLKKAGFRWSKFNRVWWAKYSDSLMEVAKSILL